MLLTSAEVQSSLEAAAAGDLGPANKARGKLRRGRAELLEAMLKKPTSPAVETTRELLIESRQNQADFDARLREQEDEQHASRMAELAETSNTIASNAELTAKALKRWTIVLAVATGVLALATIVLVFATFRLAGTE